MALRLDIPESVASSLRLPAAEAEPRLRIELAIALYDQLILPFGKAAELAAVSRSRFADLLAERGLPRHYSQDDLAQDIEYAGGQ
jgi:predicted HTH domain antitoxin